MQSTKTRPVVPPFAAQPSTPRPSEVFSLHGLGAAPGGGHAHRQRPGSTFGRIWGVENASFLDGLRGGEERFLPWKEKAKKRDKESKLAFGEGQESRNEQKQPPREQVEGRDVLMVAYGPPDRGFLCFVEPSTSCQ